MNKLPESPKFAMILGSGLGEIVKSMKKTISIPYRDIPNYPCSNISGHASKWIFGYYNNKPIICASGRCHYYEGFSIQEITLSVSVAYSLNVQSLFITNAAGCLLTETFLLTINFATATSISITACDSYTWGANSTAYTSRGTYTSTSTNAAGCVLNIGRESCR